MATRVGDLWKWGVVLRVRRSSSLAAAFLLPERDDSVSPKRTSREAGDAPVAPRKTLTAKCTACAAHGIRRGYSCRNVFLTLLPESVVDDPM